MTSRLMLGTLAVVMALSAFVTLCAFGVTRDPFFALLALLLGAPAILVGWRARRMPPRAEPQEPLTPAERRRQMRRGWIWLAGCVAVAAVSGFRVGSAEPLSLIALFLVLWAIAVGLLVIRQLLRLARDQT